MKTLTLSHFTAIYLSIFAFPLAACGDSEKPPLTADPPEVYEFESRFQEGGEGGAGVVSSVAYSGQTMRHVLISDLATYIESLDERVATDASFDPSDVEEALLSYYEFDSATRGSSAFTLETTPPALQESYDDISTDKDLVSKIAGNDTGDRDYKDYSSEFYGWSDASIAAHGGSITSPDGLVRAFFASLEDNAVRTVAGDEARDGLPVHVTESGLDLAELTEKFLLGAVAFAQTADDYLDEGIESDNHEAEEGEPYSALEHAWDEGFGYLGASRDLLQLDVAKVVENRASDFNEDDKTDLTAEYNFGPAAYAARRDQDSRTGTTLTQDLMTAFIEGRYLIASSGAPHGLRDSADKAVLAWEKVFAASAIHYINELLADMAQVGSAEYEFATHAKHFSELKGLSLAFQFNPRSPLGEEQFKSLHEAIGDAPVLEEGSAWTAYEETLLDVRQTLQDVYEFEKDDVENW